MEDETDKTDLIVRQASREANGWMIRLQDAPEDVELRRQFQSWLTNPVNAAAWEETQRMARAVAGAMPSHAESWGPFLRRVRAASEDGSTPAGHPPKQAGPGTGRKLGDAQRSRGPARRMGRGRVLRPAGLSVAAAVLAILVGPELALHLRADYATATAETLTVPLADDSLATLAPASVVALSATGGERHLRLLAGEVYLEVTPDEARPFRVSAGSVRVTVLGTGFNVARTDDGAEVSVAHGAVRVEYGDDVRPAAEALRAGEFVRVSRSGNVRRGTQPPSLIGAWRQSQLIVQDQRLGDVIDRLRRYHFGAIVVMNDSLADQPVTGVYDLGDPVGALRGIARSQDATVRQISPWLLLVSNS